MVLLVLMLVLLMLLMLVLMLLMLVRGWRLLYGRAPSDVRASASICIAAKE
jgi:hypothetical protein